MSGMFCWNAGSAECRCWGESMVFWKWWNPVTADLIFFLVCYHVFFSPLFSKVFLGNFLIIKVGLKLQKVKKLCTEVSCVACMWMNLFCCVLAFVQEYRYIMCKCTWRGLWGGRQWVGTSNPPPPRTESEEFLLKSPRINNPRKDGLHTITLESSL